MNDFVRAAALSACMCLLASAPAPASEEADATARLIEELGLRESGVALRDRPDWAPCSCQGSPISAKFWKIGSAFGRLP